MDTNGQSELLALLAWWRESGVADALDDEAIDWSARGAVGPGADFVWPDRLARPASAAGSLQPETRAAARPAAVAPAIRPAIPAAPAPSREPPRSPLAPAGTPSATVGPAAPRRQSAAALSAREAARGAATLEDLEALLADFDGCPLKATAKNLCFYRGSPTARIMIIGEAPGRDEDLAGKPFVGRAGQLLDRMLAAIDLTEAQVHITNIVYWRPPGNRVPTPEEAQACQPFLERQMELVAPDIVLSLGGPAAKALLDASDGIMRLRGRWREIQSGGRTVRVMPTLHPAYVLRQPDAKRQVWRDLLALRAALDETKES